jgi:hypothetical protein
VGEEEAAGITLFEDGSYEIVNGSKHARDLIIIPYLVVCRGITDRNQIYDIVMDWADKCDKLRRLEPSRHGFSVRVRSRIDEVMRDGRDDQQRSEANSRTKNTSHQCTEC